VADVDALRGRLTKILWGIRVALCVTGSAAAYRSIDLARLLIRHGADVVPVMTPAAARLVGPQLMWWATGNRPILGLTGEMEHVKLGGDGPGSANVALVAPATATTISRIARGDASNAVTALVNVAMGAGKPVVIAPAMHEQMYRNPAVSRAMEELRAMGVRIVPPSMEEGKAKIAPDEEIVEAVISSLRRRTLEGMRFLVTAGPTLERLDPVRVITNRGSGRTGAYLARELLARGAEVAIVSGPTEVSMPRGARVVRVESTEEMVRAAEGLAEEMRPDMAIATASPADFRPESAFDRKIPTEEGALEVRLIPTPKVVDALAPRMRVFAFRAVYGLRGDDELAAEGMDYLRRHPGVVAVAVNDVSEEGLGFGSEYNRLVLVSRGRVEPLPPLHKRALAVHIVDFIEALMGVGPRGK